MVVLILTLVPFAGGVPLLVSVPVRSRTTTSLPVLFAPLASLLTPYFQSPYSGRRHSPTLAFSSLVVHHAYLNFPPHCTGRGGLHYRERVYPGSNLHSYPSSPGPGLRFPDSEIKRVGARPGQHSLRDCVQSVLLRQGLERAVFCISVTAQPRQSAHTDPGRKPAPESA